jgi:hypothetical protein
MSIEGNRVSKLRSPAAASVVTVGFERDDDKVLSGLATR